MNYKLLTGIFATTTLVLTVALIISFTMINKQPSMKEGFSRGNFSGIPSGDERREFPMDIPTETEAIEINE